MDLKEISINAMNWVDLAQDRDSRALVNAALNFRIPKAMELVSQLVILFYCYFGDTFARDI